MQNIFRRIQRSKGGCDMKKTNFTKLFSAAAAAFLLTSCTKSVGKDGEVYKNYNEHDTKGIVDGFCYNTEEGVTHTFLCYMNSNGEPWLFDPSTFYFSEYDPNEKCCVEPGKAYTITYDVQHKTGGEAGVRESYLLKVDSCEQADVSVLFKQSISNIHIWDYRNTLSESSGKLSCAACGQKGNRFLIVFDGTEYKVFQEGGTNLHFARDKQVSIPFETEENGHKTEIGFRVLCSDTVSDERIINGIKNGTLSEDSDIFFLGTCSDRQTQQIDYANECAGVNEYNLQYFRLESEPEAGFRKVITCEQFEQGITAEQAGLPDDVFRNAENIWKSEKGYHSRFRDGAERYPYKRGILIFGGSFTGKEKLFMDDNARFIMAEDDTSAPAANADYNYAMISVRGEYLSLLPMNE